MGGKKKGGQAHTPYEAPNTLHSKQIVKILDVLSEGPVEGLANGNTQPFKSIFFNDTPVQAENGSFNFQGFELALNAGEKDQTYLPGFDVVEKTVQVGVDVKRDTPINRTVNDPYVSSVRVTVGVKSLVEMKDNGDRLPTSVSMTVSLVKNGNYYASQVVSMHEKGTEPFYQDVTFSDLPEAPFEIRVTRNTPDSDTDKLQNATIFPSYVEIIDAKLSYKYLAVTAYKFDAMQFGTSLPRINTLLKGRIVPIPTNYDPINRTYNGLWDGAFKVGWTDNPAWIVYEFAINKLYGGKLDPRFIDRASLYRVSQFCDELVDDGYGGKERRVSFNAYYTDSKPFRERLQEMCSSFFGKAIWNGQYVTFTLDIDDDPVAVYTNANVIDGDFSYEGISNSAVITTVNVQYYDAKDGYRQKTEVVEDYDLLRRYRTNVEKVIAEGCTSRSQAHRLGRYILEKSRLRTTINFKVGAEGLRHRPFDVIQIADNHLAGANIGGRVLDVAGNIITLDRDVENAKDSKFSYLGVIDNKIKKIELEVTDQIAPNQLKLKEAPADLRKFSAWSIARSDVKPKYYRALAISPGNDGTFSIKAIEHELGLHERLANGLQFERDPNSVWSSFPVISNSTVGNDGDTVVITWENINSDTTALTYIVKLYKDGKIYRTYDNLAEPILKFEGLPDGEYVAEIQARNARGQLSNTLKEYFSLNYTITALKAEPILFAIQLYWQLPTIVNTAISIELWRGEVDDIAKARRLVSLPYPISTYIDDGKKIGDQFYYWARIVDNSGTSGEFTKSVLGEPEKNGQTIVDQIQGQLTEDAFHQDLIGNLTNTIESNIGIDIDSTIEEKFKDYDFKDVVAKEIDSYDFADVIEKSDVVQEISSKTDISNADNRILSFISASQDKSTAFEQATLSVNFLENRADINAQKFVEVKNNEAVAIELSALNVSVGANSAEIKEAKEVFANELEAQAVINQKLEAKTDENESSIHSLKQSTSDQFKAQAVKQDTLQTHFDDNFASLKTQAFVESSNTTSTASEISMLNVSVGANSAEIKEAKEVFANELEAQATKTEEISAKTESNSADIKSLSQSTADQFKSQTVKHNSLEAKFGENVASLMLQSFAESSNTASTAYDISSLNVVFEESNASIKTQRFVEAKNNEALAVEIASLNVTAGENSASITDLRKVTADLDGNVSSMVTIKAETMKNGQKAVAGMSFGSDGEQGQFIIYADKFAIANQKNDQVFYPMIVQDNNVYLNGSMIAKGSISGDKIVAGTSIQAPVIKGGEININNRFKVDKNGEVSISADPNRNVGMKITSDRIDVYDENGRLRVRMGRLR